MKKSNVKFTILMVLNSIFLLFFNFIIKPKIIMYAESIMAAFMIILIFLSIHLFGYQKDKNNRIKNNLLIKICQILTIYFIVIYLLGLYFGYSKIVFSLKPASIINNTFAPIIIFISLEIFRYIIINNSKNNIFKIVLVAIIIGLLELSISTRYLEFYNFEVIYKSFADYIIPITVKQIALCMMCYHGGLKSALLYRTVIVAYTYIIPIHPNFSPTLLCVSNIILPVLLIITTNNIMAEEFEERIINTSNYSINTVISILMILLLSLIIFGKTPIGVTAIASNSMVPTFDKGSIVITLKTKESKLKEGDIISFKKNNKQIIHRINSIEIVNDEKRYYTKGDANTVTDDSYITYKDIKNKVVLSIPLIGYPAIIINEIFSN